MGRSVMRVARDYDGLDDPRTIWWAEGTYADPPSGEAYQVWQTTTFTPISPVFQCEDDLVAWLTQPQNLGVGGAEIVMSERAARLFVRQGDAPMLSRAIDGRQVSELEFLEGIEGIEELDAPPSMEVPPY